MPDLTPAQLLAATAVDMRKVAAAASPAPWRWVDRGGPTKQDLVDGHDWLIVPSAEGDVFPSVYDATYIAAWDPTVTEAVAAWLDEAAYLYAQPDRAGLLQVTLAQGIEPPMLALCRAWWASRGVEPVAP